MPHKDLESSPSSSVLILYGGFMARSGGAYNHAACFSKGLKSVGYNASIITLDSIPWPFRYLPHFGFYLCHLIWPSLSFIVKGRLIALVFRSHLLLTRKTYDYLIFEDIYLAWKDKCKYLIVVHALWSDNLEGYSLSTVEASRLKMYETRLLVRHESRIITVSSEYSRFLFEIHLDGFGAPTLPAIPLGIDIPYISSFKNSKVRIEEPFRIVFTGVFCERKNLVFMLEVYRLIRAVVPRFTLTLIGDGPVLPDLQAYARKYSLPLALPGKLSSEQLYRVIASHSVFLTTSTKESFSFSLLEAKILGLLTIAHSSLEVPSEFIDIPVNSWEAADWADTILTHYKDVCHTQADLHRYSSLQMTLSTMDKVKSVE